jgi:hypothetical protein
VRASSYRHLVQGLAGEGIATACIDKRCVNLNVIRHIDEVLLLAEWRWG